MIDLATAASQAMDDLINQRTNVAAEKMYDSTFGTDNAELRNIPSGNHGQGFFQQVKGCWPHDSILCEIEVVSHQHSLTVYRKIRSDDKFQ